MTGPPPKSRPIRVVPPEIERHQQPIMENNTNTTQIPDHEKPLKVSIVEAYPEEFQQVRPVKKQYADKFQQVHPVKIQTIKMKPGPTKNTTPQRHPRVIP